MALTECKECFKEISKKASACPFCGAPLKRKTSFLAWALLVLLGLAFVGVVSQPTPNGSKSSLSSSSSTTQRSVLDALTLDYTWSKEGFGNVMNVNFTIHNKSAHDVKDIEVTCEHFGKSGTRIDQNIKTIYDVVKAKSKKSIQAFNMGFIHSQAHTSSCTITDAKVM